MQNLKFYNRKSVERLISFRDGEVKLGEKLNFISALEELEKIDAEFVIFGIPEDIGVRANHGKAGTSKAWEAFLKAFLNVQHNQYLDRKIILLGKIHTSEEMEKAGNIDPSDPNYHQKLGDLVEKIDAKVSEVVKQVISAGKTPIIIGGGHNNAFGNIKGAAAGFEKPVNILNIDAHTDLRSTEYRHSGNGFSYALKKGILKKYFVFGLHENYTSRTIFEELGNSEDLDFTLFEELKKGDLLSVFQKNLEFVKQERFGLEVDCDSIAYFPSSAISPTGFSLEDARDLVREAAKEKNCSYLHLCEAVVQEGFPTGKALSYLVTDFIKAVKHA